MHGVRRVAVIGPAPIRPAECPLRCLQPTLLAPRPVEVDRTTALSVCELELSTPVLPERRLLRGKRGPNTLWRDDRAVSRIA